MRLTSVFIVLMLVSCKKDKPEALVEQHDLNDGMIVLCEGLFQQNNSTVSWIDNSNGTVSNSLFQDRVNRQLGDTGNDMQRYGGKVYIVVNNSSTLEIIDAVSFASIKQISMIANGISKQPRSIAFFEGNAYVSCYDGYVDVIDTTNLNVIQRILVGLNPEGLTVSNNKLYVANSGGLNAPAMDSTVSVIDLATHVETQKITVGLNPGVMHTDNEGDVYVITHGNYGAIPSRMNRIDTQTDLVIDQFNFDASGIAKMNDKLLISYYDFSTGSGNVALFNSATETIENSSYLDLSGVTTLYGASYNTLTDKIYVSDAMSFTNTGYVRVYNANGTYLTSYHVGLNPSKIVFYD